MPHRNVPTPRTGVRSENRPATSPPSTAVRGLTIVNADSDRSMRDTRNSRFHAMAKV